MCELQNGRIPYISKMLREEAVQRIISAGVRPYDLSNGEFFFYDIQLTDSQRDKVELRHWKDHQNREPLPKYQGTALIYVDEMSVVVDGDLYVFDPTRRGLIGVSFCENQQSEDQYQTLCKLADRLHATLVGA